MEVYEKLLLAREETFKGDFRVIDSFKEVNDIQFFAQLPISLLYQHVLLPVSFIIKTLFASRKWIYRANYILPGNIKPMQLQHHVNNFQYLRPFQWLSSIQIL